MRFIAVIAALCVSTISAFGEEAYLQTSRNIGVCIAAEVRPFLRPGSRIISPDVLNHLLKQKCGFLEQREEDQFIQYIERQLSRQLTAKEQAMTAASITAELIMSHTRGGLRRAIVNSYRKATAPHR